jgi:hypothetical protein
VWPRIPTTEPRQHCGGMATDMKLRAGLILLGLGAGLLSGCDGPDSAPTASSPSMQPATAVRSASTESPAGLTEEQAPGTAETRVVTDFVGFRSPSSNVGCYLDMDYVRCDIAEADWLPPPRPADCEYDYGQDITLVPGGRAEFVCAGDTALVPDGNALPYGQSISAEVLRCDSAESGITCRDTTTGHGFAIAREAYRVFGSRDHAGGYQLLRV